MNKQKNETAVFALGGLGEVGKNSYCIEHENTIILIDAGVKFAGDANLPGIDYIIPDYTYLVENDDKFKALIITHGHEDHIGGITFLLEKTNLKEIYAPALAIELIKKKLSEKRIKNVKLIQFDSNSIFTFGKITTSFFRQNHSIPDAYGIVFNTPNGNIVTTGDFTIDLTPVGQTAELQKMGKIGMNGVDLLLSDSTNAEVEAFTMSESKVSQAIFETFRKTKGRLIIATFASNVGRVQQIIEAASKFDRKVIIFGRSMENVVDVARKSKIIVAKDDVFVKPHIGLKLPPNKVLILCTGSQGEPMAALSRIANGTHKQIKIIPNDTVVFSSSPIPGNTLSVNNVVNSLTKSGATVITNSVLNNIHTSGHASESEQKLMLQLMSPNYFFPVHGEYRMLKKHAQSAVEVGVKPENTFILSNGDVLVLNKGNVRLGGHVHSDDIYVDGNDSDGLSTKVIRDRVILGNNGILSVIVAIDSKTNQLLAKPQIISRGFVYMKENTELIKETQRIAHETVLEVLKDKPTFKGIKKALKNNISPFLYQKTHRNPIIVPLIINRIPNGEDISNEKNINNTNSKKQAHNN